MRGSIVGMTLVVCGLASCGDETSSATHTAASLAVVRGGVSVGDERANARDRVAEGDAVELDAGGRARIRFDGGATGLLDARTKVVAVDGAVASMERGRAFFDVPAGDAFTLRTPKGELRWSDGQLAVEVTADETKVRVIRGSVAYRTSNKRGVVDSGQRLVLGNAAPRVEPEALWSDFTGGLAAPGPRDPRAAAGVGVLEGRRPGDIGTARWPLIVRTLDVKVRIVGDLAITDVEQTFFNPASTTLEGLYRIRVPEDAVLHRFAVDRNGVMVDGYVREKRDAAAAYQAQVYEGSTLDPALLEWDSSSSYRARIHPIVAGESRRIAIRYSEWLPHTSEGRRTYRYPMDGGPDAPEVEALSIDVALEGTTHDSVRASHDARLEGDNVRLRRSDIHPRADFVVELDGAGTDAQAFRATHQEPLRDPSTPHRTESESDYFFVPLVVDPPNSSATDGPVDLVIVADLSAGTDRSRLELGRTVIESLASQLRAGDRLAIVGGDLTLRTLVPGNALGEASAERVRGLLEALARSPSGGASDLGAMLTEAAGILDPARNGSVVYVGDGAPTVGELGAGPLLERLARLPNPLRAFAVAIGDDANADLLAAVTRGAGRVERVTTRAEAADASLSIVASAMRPVVSRIHVDLGTGIDRVFPRDDTSTTLGEPIEIIGRVRGSIPASAKVTGVFRGRPFERRIPIATTTVGDSGDLRLRWATARLERLLLDGARRTEIVDLGVRSGVITPYTSLYVPSAAELASLEPSLRETLTRTALRDESRVYVGEESSPWWYALAPVSVLSGCSQAEQTPSVTVDAPPPAEPHQMAREESGEMGRASEGQNAQPVAAAPAERSPSRSRAAQGDVVNAPGGSTATTTSSPSAPPMAMPMQGPPPAAEPSPDSAAAIGTVGTGSGGGGTESGYGHRGGELRARRAGVVDHAFNDGTNARRDAEQQVLDQIAGSQQNEHDDRASARPETTTLETNTEEEILDGDVAGLARGRTTTVTTRVTVRVSHGVRRCSDAAGMILEAKANLWEERLAAAYDPSQWARVYEAAVGSCEARTVRDRRKLLDLVLERAGNVAMMVSAYQSFVSAGARTYLRRAIFRRVRTPDELRIVRGAFGATAVDAQLVEGELARATDDAAKVRVLRRLVARFEGDLDLSMRLLQTYERLGRKDDARQLALVIRANPLTDAGLRTAIGEMFLRFGDEAEARRTFSEIVEFAPSDELARRRLGDLYRAHGWFDDAYRQYTTLAELRPDDSTVLLLLAQAAAGTGRIEEALRLEQRLAETAPPGGAEGPARTAILWSSVRLAELRDAARHAGDAAKLRDYTAAMRRGGVLREASQLRATLVWAHPDADVSLFAAHPGLGLSRPTDVSPELGLEAFDVREREDGTYRLEVRHAGRDGLTSVEAKLVVVFREGRADERIVIVPLRFTAGASTHAFVIEGDDVRDLGLGGGAR